MDVESSDSSNFRRPAAVDVGGTTGPRRPRIGRWFDVAAIVYLVLQLGGEGPPKLAPLGLVLVRLASGVVAARCSAAFLVAVGLDLEVGTCNAISSITGTADVIPVLDPLALASSGRASLAINKVDLAVFSAVSGGAAAALEGSVGLGEAGSTVLAGVVGEAIVPGATTIVAFAEKYLPLFFAFAKIPSSQSSGGRSLKHAMMFDLDGGSVCEKVAISDDGVAYFWKDEIKKVCLVAIGQTAIRFQKILGGGGIARALGSMRRQTKIPGMLVNLLC